MIVCHCEVVSDRHIRDAVACGASTVDEIGDRCAAGTRCGSCRPTIDTLLVAVAAREPVEPAA
jgi:bacterioferritin-associated ferredoxin